MAKQTLHRPGESCRTVVLVGACAVTAMMAVWVRDLDPGSLGACTPGLAQLPFTAADPANLAACIAGSTFSTFIRWDFVFIGIYVLTESIALYWAQWCWKGHRASTALFRTLRVGGAFLIAVGAAADVTENVLLLRNPVNVGILVPVSAAKLGLVGLAWVLAAVVLAMAIWRFIFPWTIPPNTSWWSDEPPSPNAARSAEPGSSPTPPDQPRYGIGLSGGGIRSAAFCAGALQVIGSDSAAGAPGWQLDEADYLATVSGGGYIGCSMQMLDRAAKLEDPDGRLPRSAPSWFAGEAPETGFLYTQQRPDQHHRYLGQGRPLTARAVALLLSVVINIVLAALVLLAVGAAVTWMVQWLSEQLGWPTWPPGRDLAFVIGVVALAVVGGVIWQVNQAEHDVGPERADSWAKTWRGVGASMVIAAMAMAVGGLPSTPWAWAAVPILGGLGWLTSRLHGHRRRTSIVSRLLFSGAWLVVAWAVMATGGDLITGPGEWLVTVVVLALFLLVMDQTWVSPHPFYKWRLASTFALRRAKGPDADEPVDVLGFDTFTHLDEWASPIETWFGDPPESRRRPVLLICAAAAIEDVSIKPRGTRAVPFVFRYDKVGSPELGELDVGDFRRALGRNLAADGTMQAAMAVSAAAVASNVGVQGRIPTVGTALALFNLRLGVWLPNPRFKGKPGGPWAHRRPGIWFLRELTGVLPADRRYVYVSDGGHLDNLGLLELVRRRCRTILLIDASGDPLGTTAAFDESLKIAKDLFHVEIVGRRTRSIAKAAGVQADRLPAGASADCVEVVHLRYPADKGGQWPACKGRVILAKAVFSASLAADPDQCRAVDLQRSPGEKQRWYQWRGRAGSVPKTSTLRQSLTDEAYTAYIHLGRAVARRALQVLAE